MSCTNITFQKEIRQRKGVMTPCHGAMLCDRQSVFNRQPCIPLEYFMGITLYCKTFIQWSITARPFSLSEVVEGFNIGGKTTAWVMAFQMSGLCQLGLRLFLWLIQYRKKLRTETHGGINAWLSHTMCWIHVLTVLYHYLRDVTSDVSSHSSFTRPTEHFYSNDFLLRGSPWPLAVRNLAVHLKWCMCGQAQAQK